MLRIQREVFKATAGARFSMLWLAAGIFAFGLVFPQAARAGDQAGCSQEDSVREQSRIRVRRGYIEIVYDALTRKVRWIDTEGQPHQGEQVKIDHNSVFAPVSFAKERIIVTICNAKFNTEPATSVSTTTIPESAPDIRGLAAQTTAVLSTATTMTLAATNKEAGTAPAPAKTEADYAQMAASYHEKFCRLMTEMSSLGCGVGCALPAQCDPIPCAADQAGKRRAPCDAGQPCDHSPCALDTLPAIQDRADELKTTLERLLPTSPEWPSDEPAASDQAHFDSLSARTKSFVDSLNNLAATLVAGDYLTRATTLAGDFAALQAALPRASQAADALAASGVNQAVADANLAATAAKSAYPQPPTAPSPAEQDISKKISKAADSLSAAAIGVLIDPTANDTNVVLARTAAQDAENALLRVNQVRPPAADDLDTATKLTEKAFTLLHDLQAAGRKKGPDLDKVNALLASYLNNLQYGGHTITFQDIVAIDPPSLLFQQTGALSRAVAKLHNTASGVFDLMNNWREHSRVTLTGVVPPPGGNAVLTVHIILHDVYSPFTFGAPPKKDASGGDTSKASSGTITAATAVGSGPEQHEVRRVLVEVHRKADANLVGSIIGSTIPLRAFNLQPGPPAPPSVATTTGGTPSTTTTTGGASTPAYYYGYQSQNQHVQLQGIAAINWYPGGRDFYPGYLHGARRLIPGIFIGTSVTATGNFVGGLDFEPTNGLDFIFGGEVGSVTELAPGVTLGLKGTQFAGTDTVPTRQRLTGGFVFGIGFDLSVFSAVFSSSSAPSSSASSSTTSAH